jgi:hypothetical protein
MTRAGAVALQAFLDFAATLIASTFCFCQARAKP